MGKFVDAIVMHVFEPALYWAINHPILTVLVVGLMIFFACRNYRML